MATTSLTTLRTRLLRELDLGVLIPNGSFDSAAAGSITSANVLQNSKWSTGHFSGRGTVIFRPTAGSGDEVRYAGDLTVSSGLLAHTGANYSDTTVGSETVELWYDEVRPDLEVLDAINRALEFVNFSTFRIISHDGDQDYDMFASTDTDWTDVGSPTTSAKATTSWRVPWGIYGYNLVNDAANEGTQSATIPVTTSRTVKGFVIVSCDVGGTASFRFYDVTNSTAFDAAAVTTSEENPQLLVQDWQQAPSGCYQMAAQLLGTVGTDDLVWSQLGIYKQDETRIVLPSDISEQFKAPSIFQARPRHSSASNVWDAASMEFTELKEGIDYRYLSHHADANPYAIMLLGRDPYQWPLFVESRQPWSDIGTYSAETDTTECPIHLLLPRVKMEVISSIYMPRFPNDPKWIVKYGEAQAEWQAATAARPVKSAAAKPYFAGVPRM